MSPDPLPHGQVTAAESLQRPAVRPNKQAVETCCLYASHYIYINIYFFDTELHKLTHSAIRSVLADIVTCTKRDEWHKSTQISNNDDTLLADVCDVILQNQPYGVPSPL